MKTLDDFVAAGMVDKDEGRYYVLCSDVFWWGVADVEEVTEADIPLLRTCSHQAGEWGDVLFCVRKRGMRPQGALYENMPKHIKELMNVYGAERPVDFFNPFNEKGRYVLEKGRSKPSFWMKFKLLFRRVRRDE